MTIRKNRIKAHRTPHAKSRLLPRAMRLSGARGGKPVLITGGAGFIGSNLAHRLLSSGQPVVLFDNLSRPGVEQNVQWLQQEHGELVRLEVADVRDAEPLRREVRQASRVFHFAAQTAVTTSLVDPVHDFEVNARGTLNLLEALRALNNPPPLLITSTNKVYGDLKHVDLQVSLKGSRYEPVDEDRKAHGFGEDQQLDFHSPYGCSKGCAGQYVLDYARTFRLPAVAFHMSCIYGPHQLGTEDQGWVAHFLIKALENAPITIYGDGRQVRDILFVEDLVDAFLLAHANIGTLSGQAFNIGGGARNTVSLLELIDLMATLRGRPPEVEFSDWRSADQRYYVSDVRKFSRATGWMPKVGVRDGVTQLYNWLRDERPVSKLLPEFSYSEEAPRRMSSLPSIRNGNERSSCRNGRHMRLGAAHGKR